jgi:hypothetical protein
MGHGAKTLGVAARRKAGRITMSGNPRRTESPVFFWIVMLAVLAVIVAAFWSFIVSTAIPFIEAVRDALF